MAMYDTREFRRGLKVEMSGDPWSIVDFQHVSPGKGSAFTRVKLKNLRTGQVVEHNIKRGDKLAKPNVEERSMQFLYKDAEGYHFMDTRSYEQISLAEEDVKDIKDYMLEQSVVQVLFYNGRPIGAEVDTFVELRVAHTEPAIKGDTATNASKPATLETGFVVNVPLHIRENDVLRIDTRTGEYMDRVQRK